MSHRSLDQIDAGFAAGQRQRLLSRQAEVCAELAIRLGGSTLVEHAHEVLQQDDDDAPQRDSDREVDFALTDQDAAELAAIAAALARLDHGTYGNCADCGVPIDRDRLAHMPSALRCVACEGAREALAGVAARPVL